MKRMSAKQEGESASDLITGRIAELDDWRGDTLARIRILIKEADPNIVEEWKWGIPVWSHDGIVCTGETYKNSVKMTFAKGAFLNDAARLFTSSLEGNTRRAIDIQQGEKIKETALKALFRAAAELNVSGKKSAVGGKKGAPAKTSAGRKEAPAKASSTSKKASSKQGASQKAPAAKKAAKKAPAKKAAAPTNKKTARSK